MAGVLKVDSINADSNLALKIANTAVAFIDSNGLRPTSGNVSLDATATSKFYLPSANTVAIQTAGVTAVTVDSSQNTTLAGTLTTTGITNSGVATATRFNPTGSSVTGNGMYLPAANSLGLSTSGTNAVYIDSSQNVGIGTTTPARRFHFKAAGVTTLANSNGALFTDASNAGVLLGSDNVLGYVQGVTVAGTATVDLILQPFGGNTGIGLTSAAAKLEVNGQIRTSGSTAQAIYIYGAAATAPYITINQYGVRSWDIGAGYYSSGTFSIQSGQTNGVYLGATATAWASASDERLKDIIEPINNALTKVNGLRSVIGKYKTDEEGVRRSFLIAQDIQTQFPEALESSNSERLGVQYTDVIPLLVASIKELKAINDTQAATIAALTARMVAVESK